MHGNDLTSVTANLLLTSLTLNKTVKQFLLHENAVPLTHIERINTKLESNYNLTKGDKYKIIAREYRRFKKLPHNVNREIKVEDGIINVIKLSGNKLRDEKIIRAHCSL